MATHNRILRMIGLAVAGSLVWAAGSEPSAGQERPGTAGPSANANAPAAQERFLLLTSGQLIPGIISQDGSQYSVVQRVGVMQFPQKRVEGVFSSVRDAYDYRVQQLPDRDYDERMKLAHWCLKMNLIAEAKDQLRDIAEHNPNNRQARAMLVSIEQAATRAAIRQRDPEIRQTRAEEMADPRPGALDSAVIRRALRELGISNLPVIFDLPVPVAIKRAEEFGRYINPLLQVNCAKCHNGDYDGPFQLVPTKSRADRTPEALRANLDATLRLVDPKNPTHSELLSSTLRAHGHGPRPRPIFPGSNDPTYQILAAWVHNLCPPVPAGDAKGPARVQTPAELSEPFAVDREQIGPDRTSQVAAGPGMPGRAGRGEFAAGMGAIPRIPPPSRPVRQAPTTEASNAADPQEFPLPFVITGVKPNLPPENASSMPPASAPSAGPAIPASSGASPAAAQQSKQKDESGTPKKPKKPLTIDPKLLERALQNRNVGR